MDQEKNETQSKEELYRAETHCPSCGRFVGVYTRCPYCQALTQKRLSIRVFKAIALLTSTVGLVLLLFFAKHVETPLVEVADLGPLSNFAHVRIKGIVKSSYGIHPSWKSLSFTVQSGEGEKTRDIRVSAYSKIAAGIEKLGAVPEQGDEVTVEGQVRFQKNSPSLLLNAPEHIKVIKKSKKASGIKSVTPAEITTELLNRFVKVTGSVIGQHKFESGIQIELDNGDKGIIVWIPNEFFPAQTVVNSGDLIEATGQVLTFKDKLEVKVNRANSFKVVNSVEPTTSAGEEKEGD